MSDQSFAGSLREEATRLMANAAKEDHEATARSATVIEYFVKLAAEVDFINFANTEVLAREIGNLFELIESAPMRISLTDIPPLPEVSIANIFSSVPSAEGEQQLFMKKQYREKREVREERREDREVRQEGVMPHAPHEDVGNTQVPAEVRQSAILEKIRQSGNCRIRDLQELLPDSSERTIRYDLQTLVERDLVERIGNGGPAVFYRIRQTVRQ